MATMIYNRVTRDNYNVLRTPKTLTDDDATWLDVYLNLYPVESSRFHGHFMSSVWSLCEKENGYCGQWQSTEYIVETKKRSLNIYDLFVHLFKKYERALWDDNTLHLHCFKLLKQLVEYPNADVLKFVITEYLNHQDDPDCLNKTYEPSCLTLMHDACRSGSNDNILILLYNGADINVCALKRTPIMTTCISPDPDGLIMILDECPNIDLSIVTDDLSFIHNNWNYKNTYNVLDIYRIRLNAVKADTLKKNISYNNNLIQRLEACIAILERRMFKPTKSAAKSMKSAD